MPNALIVGNWKMHGRMADAVEISRLASALASERGGLDVVVCPPFPLIAPFVAAAAGVVKLGGQTLDPRADGPHTGEVSAAMLRDVGAEYVLVGHSERRTDHGETDACARARVAAAHRAGLVPILCVGERLDDHRAGRVAEVIRSQALASLPEAPSGPVVVAYEPVWAIGSGLTPGLADIAEAHGALRAACAERFAPEALPRVLYGGSVRSQNAAQILAIPGVDGALVGGASLRAHTFLTIIRSHPALVRAAASS